MQLVSVATVQQCPYVKTVTHRDMIFYWMTGIADADDTTTMLTLLLFECNN